MSGCKGKVKNFIGLIDQATASRLNKGTLDGAGSRLQPSRTPRNDEDAEFRIDQGHVHDKEGKVYDIVLQANRQAKSEAIKEFVKKNSSHAKLATATIDRTKGDVSAEIIKAKLMADFERREKESDFE